MRLYSLIEQIDEHRKKFEKLELNKAVIKARSETSPTVTNKVAQFLTSFRDTELEIVRRQANGHRIKSAVCSCGCSFYSTGGKLCPECRMMRMQQQV